MSRVAMCLWLLFLLAGCERGGSSAVTIEAGLEVRIESPASGTTIPTGREIEIISSASDPTLIARVELYINGELIREDAPPAPQENFRVVQRWVPPAPGPVRVEVVAYNARGRASRPAAISLTAEGAALATANPLPSRSAVASGTVTPAITATTTPFPSPTTVAASATAVPPPPATATVAAITVAGTIASPAGVNIRQGPGGDTPRTDGLMPPAPVTGIARNAFGDWVKIRYGADNRTGWVFTNLVQWQGDVQQLPVE